MAPRVVKAGQVERQSIGQGRHQDGWYGSIFGVHRVTAPGAGYPLADMQVLHAFTQGDNRSR